MQNDQSYIDIGSWIGITSLYGCQIAKHCYAIEPDPIAHAYLLENICLNPNLKSKITVSDQCIYNKNGPITIGNTTSLMGGDSMSRVCDTNDPIRWPVKAVTFEKFLCQNKIGNYNFIKIDIEGAEFIVLPSMAEVISQHKPTLFFAVHYPFFGKKASAMMEEIIIILKSYKHIFLSTGQEIRAEILSDRSFYTWFFEILATDVPIEKIQKTQWGKSVKAL